MKALFYDTETSGLPLFNEPSEDPRQPHIVQLGAALVDLDTFRDIASIDLVIRPEGWVVPDDVAAIHGITTERALEVGVSASLATGMLMDLWERSDVRIAHNESFDARLVRIALMRHATVEEADAWKAGKAECTQALSTPILKLPPTEKMIRAGRRHAKSANLGEAYRFFTGKPLEGAHSAMVDVRACIEVYRAIKSGQREAVAA